VKLGVPKFSFMMVGKDVFDVFIEVLMEGKIGIWGFGYFLPEGKFFIRGKKKAISILAKTFALLLY
jgi:hypothetical protein